MPKVKEEYLTSPKKTITLVITIANKMIKELGFVQRINELVEWDKNHWTVSPGGLAKALVLATFTDMRVPLTHLQERLDPLDLSYLIDMEGEPASVNSFNVGRALERIGDIDYNRIYSTMALTAIQQYKIPVGRIHSDTTTLSFYGEYDIGDIKLAEDEEKELLKIEKGYNKDGRPGCNQAV